MMRKLTTQEFVNRSEIVHRGRYDYSKVVFLNTKTPVEIGCRKHGSFFQLPGFHLKGSNCPKCAYDIRKEKNSRTFESFLSKAKSVHGERYQYSKDDFSIEKKVSIQCKEHGWFKQNIVNHLNGSNCPKCVGKHQYGVNEYIEKAKNIHGDKYDYSNCVYINNSTNVVIGCNVHGEFVKNPYTHLNGEGCPKCGRASGPKKTVDELLSKARRIHGNRYDYCIDFPLKQHEKMTYFCTMHGKIEQWVYSHLNGHGCPVCGWEKRSNVLTSKDEVEIVRFLTNIGFNAITNNRSIIYPLELDIVIEEKKIAIEYCGLFWHSHRYRSSNYHLDKLNQCNKAGYRLITIFEDEWIHKQELVKSKLKAILGKDDREKIFARKCSISEVDSKIAKEFFESNHIQGNGNDSIRLGLYYVDELVACLSFKNKGEGVYDLNRYATSKNVVGGFSKLLTYFKQNFDWKEIITFADRRWSEGNLYLKNGFDFQYYTKPNYTYVRKQKRESRIKYQKHKLSKILTNFDPALTEIQNTEANGLLRIYDCGNMKFRMVPT